MNLEEIVNVMYEYKTSVSCEAEIKNGILPLFCNAIENLDNENIITVDDKIYDKKKLDLHVNKKIYIYNKNGVSKLKCIFYYKNDKTRILKLSGTLVI